MPDRNQIELDELMIFELRKTLATSDAPSLAMTREEIDALLRAVDERDELRLAMIGAAS